MDLTLDIYISATWGQKTIDWCKQNNVYYMQTVKPFIKNTNIRYALDNGAFSAYRTHTPFDENLFLKTLEYIYVQEPQPDFVAIPDIVAAGKQSYIFSLEWMDKLPEEFTYYFVVQDGITTEMMKDIVHRVSGIFVGGTKLWKLRTMSTWIHFAHTYNKPCHIGRMSVFKDMDRAYVVGADSIDGSTLVRNGRLTEINQWRDHISCQARL